MRVCGLLTGIRFLFITGLLLDYYWFAVGLLLVYYWSVILFLQWAGISELPHLRTAFFRPGRTRSLHIPGGHD